MPAADQTFAKFKWNSTICSSKNRPQLQRPVGLVEKESNSTFVKHSKRVNVSANDGNVLTESSSTNGRRRYRRRANQAKQTPTLATREAEQQSTAQSEMNRCSCSSANSSKDTVQSSDHNSTNCLVLLPSTPSFRNKHCQRHNKFNDQIIGPSTPLLAPANQKSTNKNQSIESTNKEHNKWTH